MRSLVQMKIQFLTHEGTEKAEQVTPEEQFKPEKRNYKNVTAESMPRFTK